MDSAYAHWRALQAAKLAQSRAAEREIDRMLEDARCRAQEAEARADHLDRTRPRLEMKHDQPWHMTNDMVMLEIDLPPIKNRVPLERQFAKTAGAEALEMVKIQAINEVLDYMFKTWIGKPRTAYVGDYRQAEMERRYAGILQRAGGVDAGMLEIDSYPAIRRA